MPELPEVEVTRRGLHDLILQAKIDDIVLGKPLRWPLGVSPSRIIGQRIMSTRRRGKYLLLDLDHGVLMVHLGMSGSLAFYPQEDHAQLAGKHDHFDMHTTRGLLRFTDPRRFGAVIYAESEDSDVAQKLLGHLGLEPLEPSFDLPSFTALLARKRSSIKSVLLSGRVVVGVGNIYASEVLFLSGIHPEAIASDLDMHRIAHLHAAIKAVLESAISLGGSTLRNFSSVAGQHGQFQREAYVYGRLGQTCRRCTSAIELLQQCQRSTYFCPNCQRL